MIIFSDSDDNPKPEEREREFVMWMGQGFYNYLAQIHEKVSVRGPCFEKSLVITPPIRGRGSRQDTRD